MKVTFQAESVDDPDQGLIVGLVVPDIAVEFTMRPFDIPQECPSRRQQ